MKKIAGARFATFAVLISIAALTQAQTFQSKQNGNSAYFSGYGSPGTYIYFAVDTYSQNGKPPYESASIYYQINSCSPYSCALVSAGYGPISPNLVSENNNSLTISVPNAAALSSLYYRVGSSGAVNLTFNKNGDVTSTSTGTNRQRTQSFTVMSSGTSEFESADVSGSIFGYTPPVNGTIADQKSMYKSIVRNN